MCRAPRPDIQWQHRSECRPQSGRGSSPTGTRLGWTRHQFWGAIPNQSPVRNDCRSGVVSDRARNGSGSSEVGNDQCSVVLRTSLRGGHHDEVSVALSLWSTHRVASVRIDTEHWLFSHRGSPPPDTSLCDPPRNLIVNRRDLGFSGVLRLESVRGPVGNPLGRIDLARTGD